jgi:thiamine biosynthesis protein ThiS
MQIIINGQKKQIDDDLTINNLLQQLRVDICQVAVEKNSEIIPRSNYEIVQLADGDEVELVEFVGGG